MKFVILNASCLILMSLSQEICYLPLDVMFLQDTTGSFDDDLPNVVKQIPEMLSTILANHPDSHFGVAEFKDKPYFPLGEKDDFCYKLGEGKLSNDTSDFDWAYSGLYASGGGDLPEAQFQALINTALDPAVGWRPLTLPPARAAAEEAGARLIILSTDAVPHLPGDISKYDPVQFPDLPHNLPPNSGVISTGDVNYECQFQDYPEPQQMKEALISKDIYLAILTPEDPDVVPGWKWVNEELLGQPSDFYQFISSDSSDLIQGVLKAIESVTSYLCPTTTEVPTTQQITESPTAPSTAEATIMTSPPVPTTTSEVSSEASTQYTLVPETTCPPCEHPCPDPCQCCPVIVIKLAERPSYFKVDYRK